MLAEGKNPCFEALMSGKEIEKILVLDKTQDAQIRQCVKLARDNGVRVEFVQKAALDRVSLTGHHQNIIAYLADFKYSELGEILKENKQSGKRQFYVLLDKLSDPHNLGSIIRTAECVNATAVIIPERNSVLVNETVIRTSAGAANFVKVCKVKNLNDAIKQLKENNIFVYVADMDGQQMYRVNLKGDIAIVVGSEGFGVSRLTKSLSDGVVKIPMSGNINSLNASVSAAVVMYEVVRQNLMNGK